MSVAIKNLSKTSFLMASLAHKIAVRRFPAVHTCIYISVSLAMISKYLSSIETGPPLIWKETSGLIFIRSSPVIGKDPGIDAPPV